MVLEQNRPSMNSWAPLWNGLVDSSIWEEPDNVFRVFMAMMSLKDMDHIVRLDGYKLARRIHMEPEVVNEAIKSLSEPDKLRPDQEYEGRRIKRVEEGWLVLNGEKYREAVRIEMRRARNRKAQQNWRDRQKQLEDAGLTPKQQTQKEEAATKEYAKRRKPIHEGKIAGATQAIQDGFSEAQEELDRISQPPTREPAA